MLVLSCAPGSGDTTTTTTAITSSTSTVISSTTTTPPPSGRETAVYLFFEGYPVDPGPYLVPASRGEESDLRGALASLLAGPTADETAMGLSSAIPSGTSLIGVDVAGGIAKIDLTREFETGGGSLSMMGRVAQVVYTATRFESVDAVRFFLEGEPLDVLGGEGLIIDQPQTRDDWVALTPSILIEEPTWGQVVQSPLEFSGSADLESGELSYVIVDAEGLIVDEAALATTSGQRTNFNTMVTLDDISRSGLGSVIVWEWAPDGSQRHVLEYPITLE